MNQEYLKIAMDEAILAYQEGEIPIGAVIVKDNKVIAKAHNLKEQTKCATKHAEIIAIEEASSYLNDWRLNDCDMYVTMEPCIMCTGALIQARLKNVYYLIDNAKFGGVNSIENILSNPKHNHHVTAIKIDDENLEKEMMKILKKFFIDKR